MFMKTGTCLDWRLAARWVSVGALLWASHLGAQAQTVMVYGQGQTPSGKDVADILSRGATENIKLRGQMPPNGAASPFAALEQKPTTRVTEATALSVPVVFAFDSVQLTPQARVQLNTIAEGIRLTEGTIKVVIEGHTDAKGSMSYNEALSLRRAAAVRDYLVGTKGLSVKLLLVEGLGPRKLLDPKDPLNPRNRRVQFRAG
jgi:outer membrane protein OmpA-like peptidoglycan-associated protein